MADDNNDHDDRSLQLEIVLIILVLTCLTTVLARCYTMGFILKRFFVEDYLAVLALLVFIAFSALAFVSLRFGLGKHNETVAPADRVVATKFAFIASVIYIALSYLVKVIVGLFLVRICSASHQKWQRVSIWAMLALVGLFYGAYFFIALFACQPVEYVWERYDVDQLTSSTSSSTASGKCNPSVAATAISYIATVMNCAADWMLAILPATVVWRAQLDRRTKISISVILGIGSIASIATLVRVPYTKYLVNQADYLYNFLPLALWSTIEVGVAITASSLATLRPLFRKFGAIFTMTINNTTNQGSDSRASVRRRRSSAANHNKTAGSHLHLPRVKAAAARRPQSSWNYHHGRLSSPGQAGLYYDACPSGKGGSLPSSGTRSEGYAPSPSPVSYPKPAMRWHYANCGEDIELAVPGSPMSSSDGLYSPSPSGVRKPRYSKGWEDTVV